MHSGTSMPVQPGIRRESLTLSSNGRAPASRVRQLMSNARHQKSRAKAVPMIARSRHIVAVALLALSNAVAASALEGVCKDMADVSVQAAQQRMQGASMEDVKVAGWPEDQDGAVGVGVRLAFVAKELHSYAMRDFAFKYCMVLGTSDGEQLRNDHEALKSYRYSAGHCVYIGSFEKASYRRCMAEASTQSRTLLEQGRGYVVPD